MGEILPSGKIVLSNAFSLSMLPATKRHNNLLIFRITEENVKHILRDAKDWISAVGHESTAEILSERLGVPIPPNRITVTLDKSTTLIVAQLMGPRKEFREMSKEEVRKYPIEYFLVFSV